MSRWSLTRNNIENVFLEVEIRHFEVGALDRSKFCKICTSSIPLGNHTVNGLHIFRRFSLILTSRTSFSRLFTNYFVSGSLFRIFHVYYIFSENQVIVEKSWILCRKYCRKHGYSSIMRWDSVIHLTFSTVFRHKIQDFSMMS